MKFGLRIPPCESPGEVASAVVRAEAAGFDYAWIPDSQLLWRDVWVTMGVAADRTSKIVLGTNVTNPITRDVTVTACAATSAEELAPGRFILGLGVGESSVRVIGRKPAKIAETREFIRELRLLVAGQQVDRGGRAVRMIPATGAEIPIYVSATGPKMLQFAGEVADGVITITGIAPSSVDYTLTNIEIGARKAGRQIGDIDVVTGLFCYVGDDWHNQMKLAQPFAALHALRYPDTIAGLGIVTPDLAELQAKLYPDLLHPEDWDKAIELTQWLPDEIVASYCEEYCLMGPGIDIAQKIATLQTYGISNLYLHGFYSFRMPTGVLDAFAQEVIPRFSQAGPPASTTGHDGQTH